MPSSARGSQKTVIQVPFTTRWFLYEFSSIFNIRHSLIFPGNETAAILLFFLPFPGKDSFSPSLLLYWMAGPLPPAEASGFLRTRMTESPLRNIFGMYRSLFTGFDFFLPGIKQ